MSKIISARNRVECVEYRLNFENYSFDADENGNVLEFKHEAARNNYNKCIELGIEPEFRKNEWSYIEAAVLKCDCGEEVYLDGFTNTCDCGFDYNMSGHKLASRSQWGEETGEHLSDILRIE